MPWYAGLMSLCVTGRGCGEGREGGEVVWEAIGEALGGVPDVDARGQGGLLDIALAPDFAEELEPEVARGGGGGGADAISAMFCVQFAFGSKAVASALLRQASTDLACTRV